MPLGISPPGKDAGGATPDDVRLVVYERPMYSVQQGVVGELGIRPPIVGAGLSDRFERIRLVAWSYLDACESGGGTAEENVSSGSTESRAPSRNHELWHQGSYAALERALDSLPPYVRLRFWVFYIRAKGPFRIYPEKHTHHAAFYRLARCMPKEVFVPAEISEAAGFLPAEAKTYSR